MKAAFSYRTHFKGMQVSTYRIMALMVLVTVAFLIIIGRLFQLQVMRFESYSALAESQHFGAVDLPARRGEILVRDTHSGELSKLATNTTLDLLYVDPLIAEDKEGISKKLAPLLFRKEDYDSCVQKPDECAYSIKRDVLVAEPTVTTPQWSLGQPAEPPANAPLAPSDTKSYPEMVDEVAASVFRKISKSEVDFVVLKRDADADLMAEVINARLPGVFVDAERFMIYGDPTLIPDGRLSDVSQILAPLLGATRDSLEKQLARRKVRYVFLQNRLSPDTSRKIKDLKLKGVVLIPEHWRYYPEGSLASHLIGFLNREGVGQYGIEGYFNSELEGKKGAIYGESDPFGRQITVGDSQIINAVDGDTIVLTIDRIVQKKVEEILSEAVERYRADSGQVIIMDPFTGAIIAMANYPSFDPNTYNDVYRLRALDPGEEVYKTIPIFAKDEKGKYLPATPEQLEDDTIQKYVYENRFGAGAFKNKVVSEFYEPGSVFKTIVMAIALDAKEVTPETTFIDDGPLKIDEFEIKNSDNNYHGRTNMSTVLAKSLNTGMSFVAKKVGMQLLHKYLSDFGFGEYTNIELEGETKGRLDYYKQWSKAQLLTTSFGQGIIVTPLQMITAWAALANGGKLMQPYIVDSIIREGQVLKNEPKIIQRVISEATSGLITAMSINAVRLGVARPADIPGYLVAGKTGTAQIAGSDGKYEKGDGAYITSYAGYLPALKPKFVMLVKFDRPRIGENTWGSTTAAPTFKAIAEYLIDYYNLQPDEPGRVSR